MNRPYAASSRLITAAHLCCQKHVVMCKKCGCRCSEMALQVRWELGSVSCRAKAASALCGRSCSSSCAIQCLRSESRASSLHSLFGISTCLGFHTGSEACFVLKHQTSTLLLCLGIVSHKQGSFDLKPQAPDIAFPQQENLILLFNCSCICH